MTLDEFKGYVIEWCKKNHQEFVSIEYIDGTNNRVEIHMTTPNKNVYGVTRYDGWIYNCYMKSDMTFQNLLHGLHGKVNNRKLIV